MVSGGVDLVLAHGRERVRLVVFCKAGARAVKATTVLVQGGGEEEILSADLDLSCIRPLRAAVPVFHDRRPELYRL